MSRQQNGSAYPFNEVMSKHAIRAPAVPVKVYGWLLALTQPARQTFQQQPLVDHKAASAGCWSCESCSGSPFVLPIVRVGLVSQKHTRQTQVVMHMDPSTITLHL